MNPLINQLLPAVEQQLASPDTPYVRENYERLISKEGISEEEARQMIALCLIDETDRMAEEKTDFNVARYQMLLGFLPTLPEGG